MDVYENGVVIGHADEPGPPGPPGYAGAGPSFMVNEAALELLATLPEDVPIERLTELGVHYGIEGALRHDGTLTIQKATVYEWLTVGMRGPGPCPCGPEGPLGPLGATQKSAMPWYVTHILKQQRRKTFR